MTSRLKLCNYLFFSQGYIKWQTDILMWFIFNSISSLDLQYFAWTTEPVHYVCVQFINLTYVNAAIKNYSAILHNISIYGEVWIDHGNEWLKDIFNVYHITISRYKCFSRGSQIHQPYSEECLISLKIMWKLELTNTSIQFIPNMFNGTDISGGFQS